LDFAVKLSLDIGILANDVAFDRSGRPNDNLAVGLEIAYQITVEPEVCVRQDVAADNCAFDNPVGLPEQIGV